MQVFKTGFLLCIFANAGVVAQDTTQTVVYKDWMRGPFTKPATDINPVLGPNFDLCFICPVQKKQIRWESRAIIGGAMIVKDGKIYMIYQGEDDTKGYKTVLEMKQVRLAFCQSTRR